jgi:hypothetical protein
MLTDEAMCTRPDCPLPLIDEPTRAGVMALPLAVREAITRTWCCNSHVSDAYGCAGALAWHLANHAARGKVDSEQEERVHAAPLPRKARGPRRETGASAVGDQSA